MKKYIPISDMKPGMIVKPASANGSRYRKVHKVNTGRYASLWSIPVQWDGTEWVEECNMVSNGIARITHIVDIVNGSPVETRVVIHP